MALYRCTSTHVLSARDLSVLMLYANAAGASCILNCGCLGSGAQGSAVGGVGINVHNSQ